MKNELSQSEKFITLLYSTMRNIFSEDSDLSSFLSKAAEQICKFFKLSLVFIALCDEKSKEINILSHGGDIKIASLKPSVFDFILSKVIKKKNFVSIDDIPKKLLKGSRKQPESLIAFPIISNETNIQGALYLISSEIKYSLSNEEKQCIKIICSELAFATCYLRKKELTNLKHTALKRSAERMKIYLSQMGDALSSAMNLNQLLRVIVDMGIKLTGATSATLSFIENNKVSMQIHASSPQNISAMPSITMRESLTGLENTPSNFKTSPKPVYREQTGKNLSFLGIPIMAKDSLVAVLNIYSSNTAKDFSIEKLDLLDSFSKQAGLAIENAKNYDRELKRSREASVLYESARAIGQTLDLKDLTNVIITKLSQLARTDRCLILNYDRDKDCFNSMAYSNGLSEQQQNFLKSFVLYTENIPEDIWQKLTCGNPFILSSKSDISDEMKHLVKIFPSSGYSMLVPLMAREKVLGLVYLYDSNISAVFSAYQIDLIKTISMHISIAIQRAVLTKKQEEQTQQLKALLNISEILPTTRSISKVIRLVSEKASTLMDVSSCALLILDESVDEIVLHSGDNLPPELADEDIQRKISKYAISSQKTHLYLEFSKITDPEVRDIVSKTTGSIVSIPLIAKRKIIGILNLFSDLGKTFKKEHLRFLKSFADQSSTAIRNANHDIFVKNKLKELAVLFEAGKTLNSSLNVDKVMKLTLKYLMGTLPADAMSIMLFEERNHAYGYEKRLVVSSVIGLDDSFVGRAFKVSDPFVTDVFAGKYVHRKSNEWGSYPKFLQDLKLKTFISVPMEYMGNITGIITLFKQDFYNYSESDASLLSILANMSASAIKNAMLFEQERTVANILQSIVMPQKEFHFPGVDIGYKYIPSGDISGDYFDVISLNNSKFSIVIADVSGKGHSAAIYTVRVKYLLKAYALAGYQPKDILYVVNNLIIPDTESDKFISLFYIEIDTKKKILKYACAGHEPPVFYSQSENKIKLLETKGMLIGIDYNTAFQQKELPYQSGDLLVLFTDGITEAAGKNDKFFGIEGVEEIVKENINSSAQTLANKIFAAVQKHTKRRFYDDFSLITVKL